MSSNGDGRNRYFFVKVVLAGASGRMGKIMAQELLEEGEQIAAAVDVVLPRLACPSYRSFDEVKEDCDVVVDFSHRSLTRAVLDFAIKRGIPAVIATTGHSADEREEIARAAKRIPIFFCGNMSFGVALFVSLASRVAAAFPYADVEIVETHHAMKEDVPSGTALMLAAAIDDARGGGSKIVVGRKSPRSPREIAISSLRIGERTGVHEVNFDTGYQLITLRHEAFSRKLFARGALNAIRFVKDKPPALYSVKDVFDDKRGGK